MAVALRGLADLRGELLEEGDDLRDRAVRGQNAGQHGEPGSDPARPDTARNSQGLHGQMSGLVELASAGVRGGRQRGMQGSGTDVGRAEIKYLFVESESVIGAVQVEKRAHRCSG